MAAGEKTPLTRDVELGGGGKAAVRTRLRIDNACCEAEATLAKKTLHAIAGVDRVSVNVVGRIAYATHRPHLVGAQALADALNEHNYPYEWSIPETIAPRGCPSASTEPVWTYSSNGAVR